MRVIPPSSARPLRVLYCITDTDVGGAERFLLRLLRNLPREVVEPTVVSLLPAGELAEQIRDSGVPVISLGVRRATAGLAVLQLRRIVTGSQWDLVHSILVHANLMTRLARLGLSIPLVSSVRVAERGRLWQLRAEQLTWRLSDVIVAVSEGVARFLQRRGVPETRIAIIPNSVDTAELERAPVVPRSELGIPDHVPLLLFVGRLHRQKGVDVLLRAFAGVLCRCPTAWLLIVGEGPERRQLGELAQELGVARQIRWSGKTANVWGIMKGADVLVLPSRWEGMPNVVLEAMALGVPVVATRVEGVTELLSHGGGVTVPPEDADALTEAIVGLLERGPECLGRLGEAAQQYVRRFTPEREAQCYLDLYRRLHRRPMA